MNNIINNKDGFFSASLIIAALTLVTFQTFANPADIAPQAESFATVTQVAASSLNTIVITAKRQS